MRIRELAMYDVRDLPAGSLIVVPDGGLGWAAYRAEQVSPRYGEGSSKPYGRIWVRPLDDPEAETQPWFAPYGKLYLVAVEDDGALTVRNLTMHDQPRPI